MANVSTTARERQLGKAGPKTFAMALGCMGMSPGMYGQADEGESIATIQEALDRGVRLVDTGDFYGMGHNELLVGRAIRGRRREQVQPFPVRDLFRRLQMSFAGQAEQSGQQLRFKPNGKVVTSDPQLL